MSWSVNLVGKADNIKEALRQESQRLTGASKEEFDEALPHMLGLLDLNHNPEHPQTLELDANGHGYFRDGAKVSSTCQVKLGNCSRRVV